MIGSSLSDPDWEGVCPYTMPSSSTLQSGENEDGMDLTPEKEP